MSKRVNIDIDELRRLVADGTRMQKIADMFGCSRATIQKTMYKNGIRYALPRFDIDAETLAALVAEGLSDAEIGKRYSVKAATVKRRRQQYGISVAHHVDVSDDRLMELTTTYTDKEVADILGCSESWVEKRRATLGIRKAPPAKSPVDRDKVSSLLHAGHSKAEVAKILGCSAGTISRIGMELGYHSRHVDDDELCKYLDDGLDDMQIAKAMGVSENTIQEHRLRLGIKHARTPVPPCDEIARMIAEEHLSDEEMAIRYGVTKDTIRHHRCAAGIKKEPVDIPLDYLSELIDEGLSDDDIADIYGYRPRTIGAYRVRNGIFRTPNNRLYDIDRETLELYVAQGMTNSEIADIYGCSLPIIQQREQEFGISANRRYSENEARIKALLGELGYREDDDFVHNTRAVISPYEIDFYIPDKNVGIEVSPSYTHASDPIPGNSNIAPKPTNYHQRKSLMSLKAGVNLITLYDWYDANQVRDIICSVLGMNERIGARKCAVVYPNQPHERAFLQSCHLQGYVHSEYCVGLSYDGRLVCLMSFAKPRFHSDSDGNVEYELLRFASLPGTSVQGGASRLLMRATRDLMPHSIISYANLDISNGDMYRKLGFEQTRITSPSYEWVNIRHPEEHYSWNHILNKSVDTPEVNSDGKANNDDLMRVLGFVRVFNSGNLVFVRR